MRRPIPIEHCNEGTLPDFSFVEPIYFDVPGIFSPATDQHPSHDVSAGEKFIGAIYSALRNSTSWNNTLLIVTYDEHGGFYGTYPSPVLSCCLHSCDSMDCLL